MEVGVWGSAAARRPVYPVPVAPGQVLGRGLGTPGDTVAQRPLHVPLSCAGAGTAFVSSGRSESRSWTGVRLLAALQAGGRDAGAGRWGVWRESAPCFKAGTFRCVFPWREEREAPWGHPTGHHL